MKRFNFKKPGLSAGGGRDEDMDGWSALRVPSRPQQIEMPSCAFGDSGTRFQVIPQQGVPRDPFEKVADAAHVHRLTGAAPTPLLHIPWDHVEDHNKPTTDRQPADPRPSLRSGERQWRSQ